MLLGVTAAVVKIGLTAPATAFNMHWALALAAEQHPCEAVIAFRAAKCLAWRPAADDFLSTHEQLLVDDFGMAFGPDPVLFRLEFIGMVPAAVEYGVAGIDLVFQHVDHAAFYPLSAMVGMTSVIHCDCDRMGAHPFGAHVEDLPHHGSLLFLDHDALSSPVRHRLVPVRHAAAVKKPLGRILDHAAPGVLADAPAGVLVKHLHQRFQHPAFVGLRVDRH
nr:hypothetical protein [Paucimonas lemoignei]